jgi:hypothetical protein
VKDFLHSKGESFNYGKHYTIAEKSYIIHTLPLIISLDNFHRQFWVSVT